MSDEYIRKDVHDANMAEIRALMAASEARHERIAEEMRGDVRNMNTRLDGVVDTFSVSINDIKERIEDVKNNQAQNLTVWGIIIAVVVGLVQAVISLLLR